MRMVRLRISDCGFRICTLQSAIRNPQSAIRTSDHRPVGDLGVRRDDDDAVADVVAGALALLDALLVRDHAVAADGGVEVHDGVLDPRALADAGPRGALDGRAV